MRHARLHETRAEGAGGAVEIGLGVRAGADHDDAGRAREVQPERRRARGQRRQPALLGRGERLLEQRAADRLLLGARDIAETRHRGEQRRARLGGRLDEAVETGARPPGDDEPAARRAVVRGDRGGDRLCPAGGRELEESRRAAGHAGAQLVDRRPADDDLRPAVRADDDHGRVEEPPEALCHRALGLGAAQRVDEVALQRGQAPEDADLVARERALDVVDDVAERRLVRHREHREPVLATRLDERGRHALEDDALAEAEPTGACGGELADEIALGARVPAQPHARREHDPLGLQESGRRLDLDDVRAGDRATRGGLLTAQQPQPVGALGEQVTERQPRSRAGGHVGEPSGQPANP